MTHRSIETKSIMIAATPTIAAIRKMGDDVVVSSVASVMKVMGDVVEVVAEMMGVAGMTKLWAE